MCYCRQAGWSMGTCFGLGVQRPNFWIFICEEGTKVSELLVTGGCGPASPLGVKVLWKLRMDCTRDMQWGLLITQFLKSWQQGATTFLHDSGWSHACLLWKRHFIFNIWANDCRICLTHNHVQGAFTPKPWKVSGFGFSPPLNPVVGGDRLNNVPRVRLNHSK